MVLEFLLVGSAVFSGLDALEHYQRLRRKRRKQVPLTLATTPETTAQALSTPAPSTPAPEHPLEVDYRLRAATSSLGFSLVGTLVNPLFFLPGTLGMLVATSDLYARSYQGIRNQQPVDTYTLVSISLTGCLLGQYYLLGSTASVFYTLSRKLLLKTRRRTHRRLGELFLSQQPRTAWVMLGGVEREIALEALRVGDRLVVYGGQLIPADGLVLEGQASIDQQLLTGEAMPVERGPGEQVFAATLVLAGRLEIHVSCAGKETVAGEMANLLNRTLEYRGEARQKAEQLADATALPTLLTGLFALPLMGPFAALAVVNSHVGYRMSMLESLNNLNHFQVLSERGVLVKDARILDELGRVDTVIFDKTGVLTREEPQVCGITCYSDYDEAALLALAASVEQRQSHPLARAIVTAARQQGLTLLDVHQVSCQVGQGLSTRLPVGELRIGSARFLAAAGVVLPEVLQHADAYPGHTRVLVALDQQLLGVIELQSVPRPEAAALVESLQRRGLEIHMLSGDHAQPTRHLAQVLGIQHHQAELLPADKARIIQELQAQGQVVCYVGDGLNDAVALTEARVAVSLAGAAPLAMEAADALLLGEQLQPLQDLLAIGPTFTRTRDSSFSMILAPAALGATGVWLFNFGLLETLLLKQLGLGAGLTRVMLPRWQGQTATPVLSHGSAVPPVAPPAVAPRHQFAPYTPDRLAWPVPPGEPVDQYPAPPVYSAAD